MYRRLHTLQIYRRIQLWVWSESRRSISSWNERSRWCNIRMLWIHRSKWSSSGNSLCGRFPRLQNCASTAAGARLSKRKIWKVSKREDAITLQSFYIFFYLTKSRDYSREQNAEIGRATKEEGPGRRLEKFIFPDRLWNGERGCSSWCASCSTGRWKFFTGKYRATQ